MKRFGILIATAGIMFAFFPLMITLLTAVPEYLLGCKVDEGAIHPCYVFGINIGDTLYTMFVFGWATFVTLPIGFGVAVIGLLISLLGKILKKKQTHETSLNQ